MASFTELLLDLGLPCAGISCFEGFVHTVASEVSCEELESVASVAFDSVTLNFTDL